MTDLFTGTRILLLTLYPLLLLASIVDGTFSSGRLRLKFPDKHPSFWIERRHQPDRASYFVETSTAEGGDEWSMSKLLACILRGLARLHARRRTDAQIVIPSMKQWGADIPDEIYTLW